LNVIPTNTIRNDSAIIDALEPLALALAKASDPVAPYQRAIPYRRNPELKHPKRKYFIAASEDRLSLTRDAHKQYSAKDATSTPINRVKKSAAKIIIKAPQSDVTIR
jgi:hypothetical protein